MVGELVAATGLARLAAVGKEEGEEQWRDGSSPRSERKKGEEQWCGGGSLRPRQ